MYKSYKRIIGESWALLGFILVATSVSFSVPNRGQTPILDEVTAHEAEASINEDNDPQSCALEDVVCEDEISQQDIVRRLEELAKNRDFPYVSYLIRLARCESGLNPRARHDNGAYGVDRGLFQINSFYHPDITDAQADSIEWSANWTMDMIEKGYQSRWVCDRII